ncbi:MAG TPA: efflux RND transporter permease subunit, partial [Fibrobacteria bacterium]|nr:efflux RND transporter permease subunit [Fibrobacteria bacterium]
MQSKLTPLITVASLATGFLAMLATPREEEPQISVPMIDVAIQAPGLGPKEIENLGIRGLERRMWEISGVDHVYSMAGDGEAMVTVRFKVGQDPEESVVKVKAKLDGSMDALPRGFMPPLVRVHGIDDVPVLALTLHSTLYGSDALREVAVHLEDEIRTLPDVAQTTVIGGELRQFRVQLMPDRMAAMGVDAAIVARAVQGADGQRVVGELLRGDTVF